MGKTLKPLIIGIIIGVVGLYAYQNPDVRLQISEFVGGILNSVAESPTPTPTAPAMVALPEPSATPTQVAPTEVSPTFTATTVPSPTGTPEPSKPTATPTLTPMPTPVPASYSIEVVSMKALEDGQVDFMLEVKNDQVLEDEIAQLQMSVDGWRARIGQHHRQPASGRIHVVRIRSFVCIRGPHAIKFSVGDSHTTVNVNIEPEDSLTVLTPTPQPTVTATTIPTPIIPYPPHRPYRQLRRHHRTVPIRPCQPITLRLRN